MIISPHGWWLAGWENDAAAWRMFCSISEPGTGAAWGRESCSDTCGVRFKAWLVKLLTENIRAAPQSGNN